MSLVSVQDFVNQNWNDQSCVFHLQASDREAFSLSEVSDDSKQERLLAAQLMASNGEGEEILYRDPDMGGAPICARRYLSLLSRDGDDDMFSSDFSDEELQVRFFKKRLGTASKCYTIHYSVEFCTVCLISDSKQQAVAYVVYCIQIRTFHT